MIKFEHANVTYPGGVSAMKDLDLEIFNIPEDRLPSLLGRFGRLEAVGQSFPVYKLISRQGGGIDVALLHCSWSTTCWRKVA